jgi:D-arabinose 1-dehydrogenase-like Zn-dependent alcohol dehydrogenase
MAVANTTIAAVKTAPSTTELREFPMPEIPDDGALMRVEVAGICGSDVKNYKASIANVIMGHENVGRIDKAGMKFLERKGL